MKKSEGNGTVLKDNRRVSRSKRNRRVRKGQENIIVSGIGEPRRVREP
jgi:hypothetical protein